MRIHAVSLAVGDLDVSADFYEHVLELPVVREGERARVTIGTSILEVRSDPSHVGPHHLAITIPSNKFEASKAWISARVELLTADGADEFETAPSWNARSLYFMSPDGTILEFIIRRDLDNSTSGEFSSSDLLNVSEVGIAVDDVPRALRELAEHGVSPYGWNAPDFAPVGDIDGLLILVGPGRPWFPTSLAARMSAIEVDARAGAPADIVLAPSSVLKLQ
jgi:catechol 2,3-dioxygenase-like lactoylglutathione lyase family enzyme